MRGKASVVYGRHDVALPNRDESLRHWTKGGRTSKRVLAEIGLGPNGFEGSARS